MYLCTEMIKMIVALQCEDSYISIFLDCDLQLCFYLYLLFPSKTNACPVFLIHASMVKTFMCRVG